MKLKERLVMVTLGFSIAIVLFICQEYFFVNSMTFSSFPSVDEKINGNRFHGKIFGSSKKKVVDDHIAAAPINFNQRNLQKMGSESNAASGTGENTDPTKGPLENQISTRLVVHSFIAIFSYFENVVVKYNNQVI